MLRRAVAMAIIVALVSGAFLAIQAYTDGSLELPDLLSAVKTAWTWVSENLVLLKFVAALAVVVGVMWMVFYFRAFLATLHWIIHVITSLIFVAVLALLITWLVSPATITAMWNLLVEAIMSSENHWRAIYILFGVAVVAGAVALRRAGLLLEWIEKALDWALSPRSTPSTGAGARRARPRGLETRTPAELREIAARYHLKITGKAGNTWERIAFFIACEVLLLGIIAILLSYLPFRPWVRGLLFLGSGLTAGAGMAWGAFIVEVAQLVAVKAQNLFGGRVHIFMSGLNIRFPWEQVTPNDYLTLRSGVTSRPISPPTKDELVPTFNNPMLRWRVFPALLLINASHAEDTIDKAGTDIFESVVREGVGAVDMKDLTAKLPEIQENLEAALEDPDPKHQDVHGSTYEEQYGVTAEIVALGSPTYPKDYKEAREGSATMAIYRAAAKENVNASRPSPDAAPTTTFAEEMDNVMINAKETVKKDIRKIRLELDANARDAAHNFGDALRVGGPAAAAAVDALTRDKGGKK